MNNYIAVPLMASLLPLFLHSTAQAQTAPAASSVQIYGLIDVGVEHINRVGAARSGLTRMPGITGTVPSRLGFRGTEDLGSGLRAVFVLESGLAVDSGTLGQGGRMWGRQAFVGLEGSWGTLSMGRQYSQLFYSILESDIMGPALYGTGSLDAYLPNSRVDNSVAWRGKFGGLSAGATYSFGRDTVNAGPSPAGTNCAGESASDSKACRAWSLMAKYDTPIWGVSASFDRQHGRTLASATDVIFGNLNSSAKTDDRALLAGYVKFSSVKLGAGVVHRENDGDAIKPKSNLWYLGVSYPITAQLTADAQWSTLRYSSVASYDSDLLSARLTYALSKRTALWAQLGHIKNDRLAAVSVSAGGPGSAPPAGTSQTAFGAGIRHAF